MDLREAIATLEKYYGETSEEMLLLQERVIQAFSFTEEELEPVLSTHPDYTIVRSNVLLRCKDDSYGTAVVRKSVYVAAVVPRVINDVFSDFFQNAVLYTDFQSLDQDTRKQRPRKDASKKLEMVMALLHRVENSGHGFILVEITQQGRKDFFESASLSNWVIPHDPLEAFVEDENGNKKFQMRLPLLEEILMPIAEEKFKAKMERKRKNPQE